MTWTQRANFATLVMWLLTTLIMAISALFYFGPLGHDFRGYYAASQVFLAGDDPYNYRVVANVLQELTGRMGNNPFYYPPWFAVAVAPFALLPYQIARTVWLLFNVILWLVGLFRLSSLMEWPISPWARRLFYLATSYLFALFTWRYEQLGIFIFFLLVASLWAADKKRYRLSGAMLALMLTKPTISILIIIAVLFWLCRNQHWQALQGFVMMSLLLLIVSLPLLPSYLTHLSDPNFTSGLSYELDGPDKIVGIRINTTFRDWLASLQVTSSLSNALYLLAALLGITILFMTAWRGSSLLLVTSIAVLVNLWLAPYALQYDYPVLTLPLAVALRALFSQTRSDSLRLMAAYITLIAILSVPIWERSISDGFWIVIGLTLLLLLALLPTNSATFNATVDKTRH